LTGAERKTWGKGVKRKVGKRNKLRKNLKAGYKHGTPVLDQGGRTKECLKALLCGGRPRANKDDGRSPDTTFELRRWGAAPQRTGEKNIRDSKSSVNSIRLKDRNQCKRPAIPVLKVRKMLWDRTIKGWQLVKKEWTDCKKNLKTQHGDAGSEQPEREVGLSLGKGKKTAQSVGGQKKVKEKILGPGCRMAPRGDQEMGPMEHTNYHFALYTQRKTP